MKSSQNYSVIHPLWDHLQIKCGKWILFFFFASSFLKNCHLECIVIRWLPAFFLSFFISSNLNLSRNVNVALEFFLVTNTMKKKYIKKFFWSTHLNRLISQVICNIWCGCFMPKKLAFVSFSYFTYGKNGKPIKKNKLKIVIYENAFNEFHEMRSKMELSCFCCWRSVCIELFRSTDYIIRCVPLLRLMQYTFSFNIKQIWIKTNRRGNRFFFFFQRRKIRWQSQQAEWWPKFWFCLCHLKSVL